MSEKNKMFQTGKILHEVIVGAFRASGTSFEKWCREQGVNSDVARQATFGISGGDRGRAILERMIADAGPELVWAAYQARVARHAHEVAA